MKQFPIPPEFPDILKDFTREILRNQPTNIIEFASKYFDLLASGLPTDAQIDHSADEPDMSAEEVESIIQDLFAKYDKDGNMYLDCHEFKSLMEDLQQRLEFPKEEVYRFLAEADINADGLVEYQEFIPLALQIIQGMYAKKRMEQHMITMEQQAEDLLVHGMSREELTELVGSIFARIDADGSGTLSKQEFVNALTSMELGMTRREINAIMFQIDQDNSGNISYREFVPFAFELLSEMTRLRLLESELENDELAQYLIDLFKGRDTDMCGTLSVADARDLLHQAMLGLTRMQIYTVISEADISSEGRIAYATFIPRAVGLIRSMLSFEKSIVRANDKIDQETEDNFFVVMDEAMQGHENLSVDEFMSKLTSTNMLSNREAIAARHMVASLGEEVPVEESKSQVWSLVKSMRRHVEEFSD